MIPSCRFASTCSTSNHLTKHVSMCNHYPSSSRRRFLRSATVLGIGANLVPLEAIRAVSPNETKPIARRDLARKSLENSEEKNGLRIVWTSRTCTSGNMPCLNADGHPVFDNPHGWTVEEMNDIYDRFLRPRSMAFTIKWMGLSHHMKEGPYTTVRTRLEGQIRD